MISTTGGRFNNIPFVTLVNFSTLINILQMQKLLVLQKQIFIFVKNSVDEGKIARFDEK